MDLDNPQALNPPEVIVSEIQDRLGESRLPAPGRPSGDAPPETDPSPFTQPIENLISPPMDRLEPPKPRTFEATSRAGSRVSSPQLSASMTVDSAPSASTPVSQSSQRLPGISYVEHQVTQPLERPLNVTDALSYLDAVKVQFHDQPDVYNHFLDIMKDFKSQLIDTPGVIKRVSYLFNGHPSLIQGFNTFLPPGYRIECSTDAQDANFITVTTPTGTTMQSTNDGQGKGTMLWSTTPQGHVAVSPDPSSLYGTLDGPAIEPAVQYVQKIKQRCDPETYKQFLEILSKYHQKPDTIDEREVSAQIARLFKDAPDLRSDFRIFMPEKSQGFLDDEPGYPSASRTLTPSIDAKPVKRKHETPQMSSAAPAVPLKRKRRQADREKEREREKESANVAGSSKTATANKHHNPTAEPSFSQMQTGTSSPRRHHPHALQAPAHPALPADEAPESDFFDRVKRTLDNRELYGEFLKLVNLFTQGFIDTARLVREARNFLGDGALMRQFCEILGWDERREREAVIHEQDGWIRQRIAGGNLLDRPSRAELNVRYGSYRRLPVSEVNVTCSGRDEMCRSVLNDEWVSHPTWSSEDSGFIAHKKNIYEEALHRSEEERHEYDFHIEALVRTIGMLEPINIKIAQLPPEERGAFKLKPNLGGAGKSIHQRVVRKIYGREAGNEVLQAMQEAPAVAIPVVLTRLKQKEEEWKRAQREWNKVWREVDARNYRKSLDHQAITIKTADKKAFSAKTFLSQIEAAREEQMARRATLVDPLFARTRPRHQLEFVIEDFGVLQDGMKLAFSFLDRTQGQLSLHERRRIETFLRSFVPLVFGLDHHSFDAAFTFVEEINAESEASGDEAASVMDDVEVSSVASSSSRAGRGGARKHVGSNGSDLRKKLLKNEQAKFTNRKTRAHDTASPSGSRPASPAPAVLDVMQVDTEGSAHDAMTGQTVAGDGLGRDPRRTFVFFGNSSFYTFLRLLEILYSRLQTYKQITEKLYAAQDTSVGDGLKPITNELGLLSPKEAANVSAPPSNAEHFYDLMLGSCERLFDNDIEQTSFEDQMRHMFGTKDAYKIFTIDKLVGSIIKQVQHILSDGKCNEILELLKRDRAASAPTSQDLTNARFQAEKIMGPEENIFRIDWLPSSKTTTFQLLGHDDTTFEDPEVLSGRWQAYIDTYVSDAADESLTTRMKPPFLRKSPWVPSEGDQVDIVARGGLEIKVCVRTYRLFFVPGTEDYLWRILSLEEVQGAQKRLKAKNERRMERLRWIEAGGLQVNTNP